VLSALQTARTALECRAQQSIVCGPAPYPDEPELSVWVGNVPHRACRPNGNSPQFSMSTQCKTKHTCRHRESTCTQVQGTREQFIFYFLCFAATQLACQLQQERTQVVCGNKEARKRLAQRHSRNSCHMFVSIVVCVCSQHALDFKT